jgi:hypothetical protein
MRQKFFPRITGENISADQGVTFLQLTMREGWRHLFEPEVESALAGECRQPDPRHEGHAQVGPPVRSQV